MRYSTYQTTPEDLPNHFAHEGFSLFRRFKTGTHKLVATVNGQRLSARLDGERLDAADVVWCLHYGNWPKYPLVLLDGNPHNLSLSNIWPARLRALRYHETTKKGVFYHPLSELPFKTQDDCHTSWIAAAKDFYRKDLAYVLKIEAQERELRLRSLPAPEPVMSIAEQAERRIKNQKKAENLPRAPMPARVPGRVWHYYQKAWLSVPEACHVADDYRVRCAAVLRGAVRFEFQPVYSEVWAFDAAGEVVKPEGRP